MTTTKTPTPTTGPSVHDLWANVMADVRGVGKNESVTTGPARFNFRGIDAVMNAVGPALRHHAISVVPTNVQVVATEHNPTRSGGTMKNITLAITWTVYGPDGDSFTGMSMGEAADAGDKAISKAHSVAYRTFLLQALCLPTDETDPDHTQYERAAAPLPMKDWRPVIDTASQITDLGKLGELWRAEGVGNAPADVQATITAFGDSIKRKATEQATSDTLAQENGPTQ